MNTLMYALGRLASFLLIAVGIVVGLWLVMVLIVLVVMACQAIF